MGGEHTTGLMAIDRALFEYFHWEEQDRAGSRNYNDRKNLWSLILLDCFTVPEFRFRDIPGWASEVLRDLAEETDESEEEGGGVSFDSMTNGVDSDSD